MPPLPPTVSEFRPVALWKEFRAPAPDARPFRVLVGPELPPHPPSEILVAGLQFLAAWLEAQAVQIHDVTGVLQKTVSGRDEALNALTIVRVGEWEPFEALYEAPRSEAAHMVRAIQRGWERYAWREWNAGPLYVRRCGRALAQPPPGAQPMNPAELASARRLEFVPPYITLSCLPREAGAPLAKGPYGESAREGDGGGW